MKSIAREVAFKYLGKPYIWGGDDFSGFDCSGFCIEILKSVGILTRKGDWTAEGLWNKFIDNQVSSPYEGCLIFWTGSTDKIIHVEYAINETLCIGASGGGSRTRTAKDAAEQNAYIKVRPWKSRKNVKGFIDPFK